MVYHAITDKGNLIKMALPALQFVGDGQKQIDGIGVSAAFLFNFIRSKTRSLQEILIQASK